MMFYTLFLLLLSNVYADEDYPYIQPIAVEVAPRIDNDADGVEDKYDKCLHSKKGAQVNSFGCENEITIILAPNKKDHNAIEVSTDKNSILIDKENQFVKLYSKDLNVTQPKPISQEEIDKMFPYVSTQQEPIVLKYTLYFEDMDFLNPESKQKLLNLIEKINKNQNAIITIIGHTDTVGSYEENERVSQKRVEYVIKALEDNGVKYLHLEHDAYGETNLAVPTEDNVAEPLNRRVEILIR